MGCFHVAVLMWLLIHLLGAKIHVGQLIFHNTHQKKLHNGKKKFHGKGMQEL